VRLGRVIRVDQGSAHRGVSVDCDLDDDGFRGPGDLLLFAAILERIFAEHLSTRSFSECTFRALRSQTEVRWPARPGSRTIL
jgi:type VI protein secretion system component VasA